MKPNIKVTHAEPVCRRNRSRKGANVQTDDKIMNIRKPSSETNNKKTYKPKNKTQRQSESRELHKNRLCYICQFCGQTFDQICHLKRHEDTHTGNKKFECEVCKKTFVTNDRLKSHRQCHLNVKGQFSCQICGKKYKREETLKFHVQQNHEGSAPEANNICEYCGKQFIKKSDLIVHVRKHTGEKPYKCDICRKAFSKKSDVTRHRRIHTQEMPYECDVCHKSFSYLPTLKKHLQIHESGTNQHRVSTRDILDILPADKNASLCNTNSNNLITKDTNSAQSLKNIAPNVQKAFNLVANDNIIMVKNVSQIEKNRLTEQSNVVLKDSCLEDISCQREINPVDIRKTEGNTQFTGKYKHEHIISEKEEVNHLELCDTEKGEITHLELYDTEKGETTPLELCDTEEGEITHLGLCNTEKGEMTPLELCNTEEGEITHLGLCNTEEGEITPLEEQTCIENNTEYKLDTSANKEIISELMGGNFQYVTYTCIPPVGHEISFGKTVTTIPKISNSRNLQMSSHSDGRSQIENSAELAIDQRSILSSLMTTKINSIGNVTSLADSISSSTSTVDVDKGDDSTLKISDFEHCILNADGKEYMLNQQEILINNRRTVNIINSDGSVCSVEVIELSLTNN
jgi:stress-induced morphogen